MEVGETSLDSELPCSLHSKNYSEHREEQGQSKLDDFDDWVDTAVVDYMNTDDVDHRD